MAVFFSTISLATTIENLRQNVTVAALIFGDVCMWERRGEEAGSCMGTGGGWGDEGPDVGRVRVSCLLVAKGRLKRSLAN